MKRSEELLADESQTACDPFPFRVNYTPATLIHVPVDLIVCVATEFEGSLLRPHVPVLCTGVGAVNAAYTLTRFLERETAQAVIVCGIAGAYPGAFGKGI